MKIFALKQDDCKFLSQNILLAAAYNWKLPAQPHAVHGLVATPKHAVRGLVATPKHAVRGSVATPKHAVTVCGSRFHARSPQLWSHHQTRSCG